MTSEQKFQIIKKVLASVAILAIIIALIEL
jgi:hypothetical protein